jgi:hypothetical protein
MLVLKKAERLPKKQRRPQAVRFESALSCLRFSREDWQNQRLRKGFHPQILAKTHTMKQSAVWLLVNLDSESQLK